MEASNKLKVFLFVICSMTFGNTAYAVNPAGEVEQFGSSCHELADKTLDTVTRALCSLPWRCCPESSPTGEFVSTCLDSCFCDQPNGETRVRVINRLCPYPIVFSSDVSAADVLCRCAGNCACSIARPLYYFSRTAAGIVIWPVASAIAVPAGALIACPCEVASIVARCVSCCLIPFDDRIAPPAPQPEVMSP